MLAELAAWREACSISRISSGGGGGGGGAAAGRQLTAGPPRLDPPPDVRALMAAIDEVHYLDVGLNCRGAYNLGAVIDDIMNFIKIARVWLDVFCVSSHAAHGAGAWQYRGPGPRHWLNRVAVHADPQVVKGLAAGGRVKPRICLHGTPRQWDDPTRPWIGAPPTARASSLTCGHSRTPHACS